MKVVSIFNRGVVVAAAGVFFFNSCANGEFSYNMKEEKTLNDIKSQIEDLNKKKEELKGHKKLAAEEAQKMRLQKESETAILKIKGKELQYDKELIELEILMNNLKVEKSTLDEEDKERKLKEQIKKEEEKLRKLNQKKEKLDKK